MSPGIHSNMNFPAAASVLGMLSAAGGLIVVAVAVVVLLSMHKVRIVRMVLRFTGICTGVYLALLLGFSVASHDTVLARGQEKYFCEIDCHLAYSIVGMERNSVGTGTQVVIWVRTRFDENTISPQRPKEVPLVPNARWARLVDSRGVQYGQISSAGTPFSTPLKPGDSYVTTLNFEVPGSVDLGSLRLLMTSPEWQERAMIGDENSWLHGKTYFAIAPVL